MLGLHMRTPTHSPGDLKLPGEYFLRIAATPQASQCPRAGTSLALENSLMAISDANRAYFEDVGLLRIRRELGWRIPHYLNNNEQRKQASEWVGEQLAKPQQEKRAAKMHETTRFYAALLVSILTAIATLVAVWPVIRAYFK
jgi:hypothetical protein